MLDTELCGSVASELLSRSATPTSERSSPTHSCVETLGSRLKFEQRHCFCPDSFNCGSFSENTNTRSRRSTLYSTYNNFKGHSCYHFPHRENFGRTEFIEEIQFGTEKRGYIYMTDEEYDIDKDMINNNKRKREEQRRVRMNSLLDEPGHQHNESAFVPLTEQTYMYPEYESYHNNSSVNGEQNLDLFLEEMNYPYTETAKSVTRPFTDNQRYNRKFYSESERNADMSESTGSGRIPLFPRKYRSSKEIDCKEDLGSVQMKRQKINKRYASSSSVSVSRASLDVQEPDATAKKAGKNSSARGQRRVKWTFEELLELWKAISAHGNEWTIIGACVSTRTYSQIKDKGRRLLQTQRWVTGKRKRDTNSAREVAKEIAKNVLQRYQTTGMLTNDAENSNNSK